LLRAQRKKEKETFII